MSFIASLAAVGGMVGVTGAIAAPLAGAGILAAGGAGLGAATSAAMGGDPGEGAMMGAVTGPLMAPLMPAAGAGAAAAENVGANVAAQAGEQAAAQTATQGIGTGLTTYGLGQAPTAFAGEVTGGALGNVAGGVGQNAIAQTTQQAGIQALDQGALTAADEALIYGGANRAATDAAIKAGATDAIQAALPEATWGQNLVGNTFGIGSRSLGAKIGGGALENAVYGAGINSGINLLTGRPITENMGTSALAGGIGGAAGAGLATQAGQPGILGKIGTFAAENPGITSTAISVPTSMALNSATAPSYADELNKRRAADQSDYLRYLRQYTPSLSPGYAAGGITDLDGYMSNAQNIPNSQNLGLAQGGVGTQNIPNQNEVADPEGYGSNSTTMMAGGGIADLGGYSKGGNLLAGPGDGVSDDIPASIAGKQPARLASGEYVVPSRIVSELGNGSTDAGAKRLDMMVQKVNAGRSKTLGGKHYAKDTRAYKHLPV